MLDGMPTLVNSDAMLHPRLRRPHLLPGRVLAIRTRAFYPLGFPVPPNYPWEVLVSATARLEECTSMFERATIRQWKTLNSTYQNS
jgi:hypothetical protein